MKVFIISTLLCLVLSSHVFGQSKEFNYLSFNTIKAQTMSTNQINGSANSSNHLSMGSIVVYKTNSGRYGKFIVMEYGYNIKIKWKTYNSNGTTYSSGSDLTIRGTWSCDLDLGIESSTNRDFFWQQATSTIRYLTPKNGAMFKVYLRKYEDVDDQFAGYVSNEEDRFVDYVWAFISEFDNTWDRTQYYWGRCYMLGSSHLSYADSVDLVYLAGHGNVSSITLKDTEGSCSLSNYAWGSFSSSGGTGDLEYIVFHSCQVLKNDTDWRSRWKMSSSTDDKPFSGLHVAMGYRTNHYNGTVGAGPSAADDFAENLEDGYSVKYAWYKAAVDNRSHTSGNKPCVFYVRPHRYETISHHNSIDYRYGDPEYLIDAYYLGD
ncbi:MAG: DUF6345 domain-containing protein [bacterium]